MKKVDQKIKEIIERYAIEKGLSVGYVDTTITKRSLRKEYVCLYDESFQEEFEQYELTFGNVATITKHDNEYLSIMLSSNDYSKEVMRVLKNKYELDFMLDSYDQLFAPHWEFFFLVKNESVEEFLDEVMQLNEECDEKESDVKMVYSVEKTKHGIHVQLTEQKDWEAFGEEVGEHYHSSIIERLKDKGLKVTRSRGDSSFYCDMSQEAVLYRLENEKNMVFDESFDNYMKKYRQKCMKEELI